MFYTTCIKDISKSGNDVKKNQVSINYKVF